MLRLRPVSSWLSNNTNTTASIPSPLTKCVRKKRMRWKVNEKSQSLSHWQYRFLSFGVRKSTNSADPDPALGTSLTQRTYSATSQLFLPIDPLTPFKAPYIHTIIINKAFWWSLLPEGGDPWTGSAERRLVRAGKTLVEIILMRIERGREKGSCVISFGSEQRLCNAMHVRTDLGWMNYLDLSCWKKGRAAILKPHIIPSCRVKTKC